MTGDQRFQVARRIPDPPRKLSQKQIPPAAQPDQGSCEASPEIRMKKAQ